MDVKAKGKQRECKQDEYFFFAVISHPELGIDRQTSKQTDVGARRQTVVQEDRQMRREQTDTRADRQDDGIDI